MMTIRTGWVSMHSSRLGRYIAALTTRRHPLAFASYMVAAVLGGTLLLGLAETVVVHGMTLFTRWVWEIMLSVGGVGGVMTLLMRPRMAHGWPDLVDLLHLEAIMAFACSIGFLTYWLSLLEYGDYHLLTSPGGLALATLAFGMAWRSVQALREAIRARQFALIYEQARIMLKQMEETLSEVLDPANAED